jgi:hypothetical protein
MAYTLGHMALIFISCIEMRRVKTLPEVYRPTPKGTVTGFLTRGCTLTLVSGEVVITRVSKIVSPILFRKIFLRLEPAMDWFFCLED